jgi:hypothetical protein
VLSVSERLIEDSKGSFTHDHMNSVFLHVDRAQEVLDFTLSFHMMFPFKDDCTGNLSPLKESDDEALYQVKRTFDYNLVPFLWHILPPLLLNAPYMAMVSIWPRLIVSTPQLFPNSPSLSSSLP